MYKILDLFCGAGGFSFGFEMNDNFKTLLAVDIDQNSLATFKNNHKHAKTLLENISSSLAKDKIVDLTRKLKINMVIGGPPCQGFSMKGKKLGKKDQRNFLFLDFLEIIDKTRPEIFIIENVKNLLLCEKSFFLKQIIIKSEQMGYKVSFGHLNASDFGVPQNRQRAIIIASKKELFWLPFPIVKKNINIRKAISDLCFLNSGEKHQGKYPLKIQSDYQKLMRNNSEELFNHESTQHLPISIEKMNLIPVNGNKFDLPLKFRNKQVFKTTWSRLNWDKISPTIDTRFDTPSNGQNIHPELNRAITPREAARIQSFPDNFIFFGNKSSVCRQIGNAVPPLLAKSIADSIIFQKKIQTSLHKKNYFITNFDSLKIDVNLFPEIDAIITDPPYKISKKNNLNTLSGKRSGVFFGDWDVDFNPVSWIKPYFKRLKKNGSLIIFCSYMHVSHIADEIVKLGGFIKDVIKWIKTNPMPRNVNSRYVQDTEFAIWAVKSKKWVFNKNGSKYKRAEIKTSLVSGKERTIHPNQKSLKLIKEIIDTHTNQNDLVLDPFMGSGTIGVAALQLQRKFIGFEISEEYFKIAQKRIEQK